MEPKLNHLAKKLRKNSTMVEFLLWSRLRGKRLQGIKFRRQQPIANFIVDFVSFEKRMVIELDGGQHKIDREKDKERDRFLAENGFTVLRFWDNEVIENIEGVLEVIRKKMSSMNYHPPEILPSMERKLILLIMDTYRYSDQLRRRVDLLPSPGGRD